MRGRRAALITLASACAVAAQPWPVRVASFHIGGGTAHGVAFAPNGSAIATTGERGDLILWDCKTRAPRWTVQANDHWIGGVAFAPDGRSLATMGNEVTVWDLDGRKLHARVAGGPSGIAYSHDSRLLAYHSGRGVVNVLDARSGALLTSFNDQQRYPVNDLAFSRDDRLVYAGDNGGRVWEFTIATRAERELYSLREAQGSVHVIAMAVHGDTLVSAASTGALRYGERRIEVGAPIYSAALAPDGDTLVTGGSGGALQRWSLARGELLETTELGAGISGLAFTATGDTLAVTTYDGRVTLRRDGATLAELTGHPSKIKALTFSADGSFVVASGARTAFFELATGAVHEVPGSRALAPGIEGTQVLTASKQPLTLVDARDASVLREFGTDNEPLALDPSRRWLVLRGGFSSQPQLFDLQADKAIDLDRWGRALDAAWSPDGGMWALGSVSGNHGESGVVEVFDRAHARRFERGFDCAVSTVAFSPDGKTLVYAKGGGSLYAPVPSALHVLDVPGFEERQQLAVQITWWRFLDDRFALAHDGAQVMLWDTRTMTVVRSIAWPDLRHAALAPDRQLAAFADNTTNTVVIVRTTPAPR